MKSRKDTVELAVILTRRNPKANVVRDTMLLCRLGSMATTTATNLCNVKNYQETYEKRVASLLRRLKAIGETYQVHFAVGGDPRGYALKMFAVDGTASLPGNTWGGDESGYGI